MDHHADAAALLLSAWRDPSQKLNALPSVMIPADEQAAYAIQRRVAEGLGAIGGWKVGAAGPAAPPNCAPPADHRNPTQPRPHRRRPERAARHRGAKSPSASAQTCLCGTSLMAAPR